MEKLHFLHVFRQIIIEIFALSGKKSFLIKNYEKSQLNTSFGSNIDILGQKKLGIKIV